MYDDLFDELDAQIASANTSLRSLQSKLGVRKSKARPGFASSSTYQPNAELSTAKKAPAFPFAKATRFKQPNDELLDDSRISNASFSTNPSMDSIKTRGPAVLFGKSERFIEKPTEFGEGDAEINPDISKIRGKTPFFAKYYPPTERIIKKETISIEEEAGPGPGEYYIEKEENKRKLGVFTKAERFKIEEKDEKSELNPKIEAIKKRAATTIIKNETEKNRKLIQKKQFLSFLDIMAAKQRLSAPIENDTLLKPHIPATNIGPDTRNTLPSSRKNDIMLFFHLADKVKELRARGPGAYEINAGTMENRPCMVVYRSCSPVIRNPINLIQKRPAPNQYHPEVELTKETKPKFTFAKAPREKPLKIEDLDWKKALDPAESPVRVRHPAALILPLPTSRNRLRALSEIKHNRMGPGRYSLIHDLVESRPDKGVLPFKLTAFNDRAVQMDAANKEVFTGDLEPNFDFDKPKAPVFKYYEPLDWHPPHPSDGMLFRERWRFYDFDLGAVKPDVRPVDFSRNMNMRDFRQFEYEYGLLEAYLNRRRKMPEIGQYKPEFNQIDPNIKGFDLEKMPERPADDGLSPKHDELILNPEKPGPKVLTFDIGKKLGRTVLEVPEEEKLLLQPDYRAIDKKIPGLVDFTKQLDRKEKEVSEREELRLEPEFRGLDPKIKGNADFGKLMAREDDPMTQIRVNREECLLEPKEDFIRPHIPAMVKMDKGGERWQKKENEAEHVNNNIGEMPDVVKAFEASKPEKQAAGFAGYSGREKTKIKISKKPSNLFKERKNGNNNHK